MKARMADSKICNSLLLLLFTLTLAAYVTQGTRTQTLFPCHKSKGSSQLKGTSERNGRSNDSKRLVMIGSTAPTCTHNECRGCKYKCRAEQVPVEGNEPINSPYHYKCVCHI